MTLQVGLLPISALAGAAAADVGSFRIVQYAVFVHAELMAIVHAELITNVESIMRSERLLVTYLK